MTAVAAGEPDSYEAACDRFNQAAAAYHRAKAEAERIMRDAEDECETAHAHLARFERSPGIPLPEHNLLALELAVDPDHWPDGTPAGLTRHADYDAGESGGAMTDADFYDRTARTADTWNDRDDADRRANGEDDSDPGDDPDAA